MKTTRTRSITMAALASTLAFSGGAGAFDAPPHPRTTRESVSSTGTPAVGTVLPGVISANGRYVVFTSTASNLIGVSGAHVYRHDRTAGTTVLVTVARTGLPSVAGGFGPTVSADGRFVGFASAGNDLVDGDTNGAVDVFLRDMVAGTTTMVSATQTGAPGDLSSGLTSSSGAHEISDDGRYVAFTSNATNLVPTPNNGKQQVYVKDMLTGVVTRASVDAANAIAGADSRAPSISADGRWVGFQSLDDTLVGGDVNHLVDVFLYDRTTEAVTLVSQNDAGQQTNAPSTSASVSSDGRFVLLMTSASNLVTSPTSTGSQLYVRDMRTNDAPVVTLGADESLLEGQRLSRLASFSDQDASTSWSATVDYGDGSGSAALALAADKTFTLDHLYKPGSYVASVVVTDDAGALGSGSFRVTVTN